MKRVNRWKMAKNPIIAAILNFWVWGTGYLYLGKKHFGYFLIPVWVLGLMIFASVHAPNDQVVIHGVVRNWETGDPLESVNVTIYDYNETASFSEIKKGLPIQQIATNSQGYYEIKKLEPGYYILFFNKTEFQLASNYINITKAGYAYELNVVLIKEGIFPYLIPEMIILEKLGTNISKPVEIFTWFFAIFISLAFAYDAYKEGKEKAH